MRFAARHGLEEKSRAVERRQHLAELDWAALERLHDEALRRGVGVRARPAVGRTPDDELEAVAEMAAAINDAPTDDLDIEDEVFSPERMRAYEDAQLARGHALFRILARHRETGELAGHSVVAVDGRAARAGHQHDTSVVAQPPRPPARAAAQDRHEPLAARGAAPARPRSAPGTPSRTTT